tara:strand:+ start:46310 stop:46753 length:444 start_codon:yes stop_codon:yes gene_type:complete
LLPFVVFEGHYDANTVGCPNAITDEHGNEKPGNPAPSGSRILAIGRLHAKTVRDVAKHVLKCPVPPLSSIVRLLQGIAVGIAHILLPQGQICITIFVHVDMCGVKVSPKTITGILFTCTIALSSVIGKVGTRGVGGHQQVKFLITIE